ncbi:MAG: hypothetical protein JRH01_21555 [Deltaproteobacteria bacterium]|nr:hypothetical protein [Deltaproteobacteria bacterium]
MTVAQDFLSDFSAGTSARRRSSRSALRVAALGGMLGLSVAAYAGEPPKTLDPDASCVTSQCHGEYRDRTYPHWEPEDFLDECTDCHEPEGDTHEFSIEEPPALCMNCHDSLTSAEVVHDPAEEDCLDCHDPHGSETPAMLVAKSQKSLCFDCHESADILGGEHKHEPVQKGECTQCHDPHSSPHSSLLRETGGGLCLGCHEDLAEQMIEAEYLHDPAEDDCIDCHDPHSSPTPKMLLADSVKEMCEECHDDIVANAQDSLVGHDAVLEGDQCVNCHSPHAADAEPLLRRPQMELCLDCHDRQLQSDGMRLIDMRGKLEENPEWHEPLREDGCTACHRPHGSGNFRMLKKAFPSRFYASFAVDSYALCFSCHKEAAMTTQRTRSATGFRDGDRNLHFLHVNREKKGRTCRACHDPHANGHAKSVTGVVRFGRWLMPLEFKKTESGGSCESSCHTAQSYEREESTRPPDSASRPVNSTSGS